MSPRSRRTGARSATGVPSGRGNFVRIKRFLCRIRCNLVRQGAIGRARLGNRYDCGVLPRDNAMADAGPPFHDVSGGVAGRL